MKKVICLAAIFLAITSIFISCTKSPKTILSSGDEWLIEKPDVNVENTNSQILQFIDDETVSFGETSIYKITWVDDYAFRLSLDGSVTIFKFGDYVDGKIKVAVLYENEKAPVNEDEWLKLHDDDRVLQLYKNKKIVETPDFYVINGKNIPADKVPPAGVYLQRNRRGDIVGVLKVLITNGEVQFQTGDSERNLGRSPIIYYDEDGSFELENLFMMGGNYEGNGVIRFFLGANGATEEENRIDYIKESKSSNDNNENILNEYIKRASALGFIYKGDERYGKIVKVEIRGNFPHSGGTITPLNVPQGKMWTPLYYEQISGQSNASIIEFFNKLRKGYSYDDYYEFDVTKSRFVSAKFSKQNNEAIMGNGLVGIIITSYSNSRTNFAIYFLEELY